MLVPNDEDGSVSTATLRTRLLVTHLMQLAAYGAMLGVGGVDLAGRVDPSSRRTGSSAGAVTAAGVVLWRSGCSRGSAGTT